MTSDPFDPFEPKEQSKAGSVRPSGLSSRTSSAPPARPTATSRPTPEPAPSATVEAAPRGKVRPRPIAQTPKLPASAHVPAERRSFVASLPHGAAVRFAAAFAAAGLVALFILFVAAMGVSNGNSNRILAGVRAGGVDLGGMTRAEAVAKLQGELGYLSQGEVTVTTPSGTATITYAQAGRTADAEAMADMALAVGHTGDPVADAAAALRTSAGQELPVVVKVDPAALAIRVHEIVGTTAAGARNAQAIVKDGTFTVTSASAGEGVDEKAISEEILNRLTDAEAPADVKAGGKYVTVQPTILDAQAQGAIASANKMVTDVKVTWDAKTWTIPANTVKNWIVFGMRTDGSYGPAVDPSQIAAWLSGTPSKANVAAIEPKVQWDKAGKPSGLTAGQDGLGIDVGATTQSVADYLDSLASGASKVASVPVTTTAIHAKLANTDLKGFAIIGSWTTKFFPGESNGNGANIRVPARVLNGQVIAPGQQFSFLQRVGPIDEAHGFAKGGVIINGKSDHTGAMGGGICSASTTVFNAAARAGLQMDERHNHAYYVNRYPSGLDATVFSDGQRLFDMKFTNDTDNVIVIRSFSTRTSVTFQLWSLPLGRDVKFNGIPAVKFKGGSPTYLIKATGTTVYVGNKSLKPNVTYHAEYPTDGFDTTVTRVVTDASGNVLFTNVWHSHYGKVDGILQIGATPSITPTPSGGTPSPTLPPATTPPAATPKPTPRRRRLP